MLWVMGTLGLQCDLRRDEWLGRVALPLPIHRLVSIALRTTTQRKYSVDDEHDAKLL
jgi:hypothetical protein